MNERDSMTVGVSSAKGLISRLRSNTAGNTLMLVAGAIIPLTAMIGSGVDMGCRRSSRSEIHVGNNF